jgi:hypothetical protein
LRLKHDDPLSNAFCQIQLAPLNHDHRNEVEALLRNFGSLRAEVSQYHAMLFDAMALSARLYEQLPRR